MNFVLDVHCHTVASGHAYSTIQELTAYAATIDYELIAMTDHGPALLGGAVEYHFSNLWVLPQSINGVEVLKGAEVNILDFDGNVDLPEEVLKRLDFVIASFHNPCITPGSAKDQTKALLKLMEKPYIHMIGHPGNPHYPIDVKTVVKAAKETDTILELNNSSLRPGSFRAGSQESCDRILKECVKQGTYVALGSDTHYATYIGGFHYVEQMLERQQAPEELILNTSVEKFKSFISRKRR